MSLQVIELWQRHNVEIEEDRFFVKVFYNQEEIALRSNSGKPFGILNLWC